MISKLLRGKNKESQTRLDALNTKLGDNPNISWYPSAGNDYRDIMELSEERARLHNIKELPDLFIHTDYSTNSVNLDGIVYNDGRTIVQIENKFELQLTHIFNYHVNPIYAHFASHAPQEPTIYLLDISVSSEALGVIKRTVIYFLFENINFLDQIILKNKIKISHFVKVREGCSFGGNGKSISIAYAFLSTFNTKYLLIDNEVDVDFKIVNQLIRRNRLSPSTYDLTEITSINDWSGFNVNIFSITYKNQSFVEEGLKNNLVTIRTER
jgi:hypothetical protein